VPSDEIEALERSAYWKDVAERALAKQHEMQTKIDHLAKQEVDIRAAYVLTRAENMQLTRENIRLYREWEATQAELAEAKARIGEAVGHLTCVRQQCETAVYNLVQREHDAAIVRSFQSIADYAARSGDQSNVG